MILCGIFCMILIALMIVMYKKKVEKKMQSPCRILLLFCVMGMLLELSETKEEKLDFGHINRNLPGEGTYETEAVFSIEGEKKEYRMSLIIPEQTYSKEEERRLLLASIEEIKATFCGENKSLEEIILNPVVKSSYQSGAVSANWQFWEDKYISKEGVIQQQVIKNKKQKVEAGVSLSCGTSKEVYEFSFWIIPLEKSEEEWIQIEIGQQIADQETTNTKVTLPEEINGKHLVWKKNTSATGLKFLGVGILAAVAMGYVIKEQNEKKILEKKRKMLLEYPEFVSKLSLLLGAGMTISKAIRKINQMYQKRKEKGEKKEDVYEELYSMICEMDNGMGELRAYQRFAERCDLQPYRKLVSLLISGQKIGNRRLMERLNEEADRVFLERKNTARKLGEEAGTKLLLPMMMMLVIVMGIVMVPAFLSLMS